MRGAKCAKRAGTKRIFKGWSPTCQGKEGGRKLVLELEKTMGGFLPGSQEQESGQWLCFASLWQLKLVVV